MFNPVWIATVLGLIGGVALAYVPGSALLRRLPPRSLAIRLAIAGAAIALLPAFFLSFVVGGTLGGAWGEHLFGHVGLPSSGVSIGLALGIALVFALVLLVGAAIGVVLGKGVLCYQQWRVRT